MMTSSDSEMDITPDFIIEEAKAVMENLLPQKSKERYLRTYDNFMKWRSEKKVKSLSENVFLIYFNELSKTQKPSTLWSVYSMLKTTLNTKHNVHLKDFERLISFLKRQSDGFKSKKSEEGKAATNTMNRINDNSTVVGTIIVNREGFPETTTLDSLTAATYSTHMRSLCRYAAEAVKEMDMTDDILAFRMITRNTEAAVIPDPEFHLIVVMRRKKMA